MFAHPTPDAPQVKCLLCGFAAAAEPIAERVRDGEPGRPSVVRCASCGHVQLTPLPSLDEEQAYYHEDRQARSLLPAAEFDVWRAKSAEDTARRVAWLRRVHPETQGEVLDVGCGYGFFVDALHKLGYRATGLDLSTERHRLARSRLEGIFLEGEVTEAFAAGARDRFRAVCLFHVLEHLRDPAAYLERCFRMLAPGGVLLVEVPNLADELLQASAPYRAFYWQRAHLSYFDRAGLGAVLEKATRGEFAIGGVQRYGVRNLLRWLDQGAPELSAQEPLQEPLLRRLDGLYRLDRERDLNCDTLVAEVRKPVQRGMEKC